MTTTGWWIIAVWLAMTVVNYSAVTATIYRHNGRTRLEIPAQIGLIMVSAMPLTTLPVVYFAVRRWIERHWNIVKIERSLRGR